MKNDFLLFDLHQDLPTAEGINDNFIAEWYKKTQLHKSVSAFWTTRINKPLEFIIEFIKKYPLTENRFFGIEDLWFVNDGEILERICHLPILYASLTWNNENALAGGTFSDSGLSTFGKKVVKKLAQHNILLDTAHLNEDSFYDVCNIGGIKIINSHCCQNSIFEHNRNITDEQIKIIIEKGGTIGLTPVGSFMKDEKNDGIATIDDFVYQIDTFCQKFDCNNIGIGTDFFGATPLSCLTNYADFAILSHKLEHLGYKKQEINKVFFSNANSVF